MTRPEESRVVPVGGSAADTATRASSGASGRPGVPGGKPAADTASRTSAAGSPSGDHADAADPSDGANGAPRADAGATEVPEQTSEEHEQQLEADLDELAAKAEKADEYLELAKRTKADFENYRKRASREAGLAQERGIAKLAKELLPAIDNLDRAVQAAETFATGTPAESAAEAESQLASGIRLVHADVLAALARVGIEPFSPVGEPFDPQYHEAVAQHQVPGTEPGTVVEVYQRGYRLGDTVLRPARVLVSA